MRLYEFNNRLISVLLENKAQVKQMMQPVFTLLNELPENPLTPEQMGLHEKFRKQLQRNDRFIWTTKWLRALLLSKAIEAVQGNDEATEWVSKAQQALESVLRKLGANQSDVADFEKFVTTWLLTDEITRHLADNQYAQQLKWEAQTPQQLNDQLNSAQQKMRDDQKSEKRWMDIAKKDEIILNYGKYAWIKRNTWECSEEGAAMGHCGNKAGYGSESEMMYSFRQLSSQMTKPLLTFIVTKDGLLRDARGKGNTKPHEKYHPYIVDFLLQPFVKGIKPPTYQSHGNFEWDDLTYDEMITILDAKPGFDEDPRKSPLYILYRKHGLIGMLEHSGFKEKLPDLEFEVVDENTVHFNPTPVINNMRNPFAKNVFDAINDPAQLGNVLAVQINDEFTKFPDERVFTDKEDYIIRDHHGMDTEFNLAYTDWETANGYKPNKTTVAYNIAEIIKKEIATDRVVLTHSSSGGVEFKSSLPERTIVGKLRKLDVNTHDLQNRVVAALCPLVSKVVTTISERSILPVVHEAIEQERNKHLKRTRSGDVLASFPKTELHKLYDQGGLGRVLKELNMSLPFDSINDDGTTVKFDASTMISTIDAVKELYGDSIVNHTTPNANNVYPRYMTTDDVISELPDEMDDTISLYLRVGDDDTLVAQLDDALEEINHQVSSGRWINAASYLLNERLDDFVFQLRHENNAVVGSMHIIPFVFLLMNIRSLCSGDSCTATDVADVMLNKYPMTGYSFESTFGLKRGSMSSLITKELSEDNIRKQARHSTREPSVDDFLHLLPAIPDEWDASNAARTVYNRTGSIKDTVEILDIEFPFQIVDEEDDEKKLDVTDEVTELENMQWYFDVYTGKKHLDMYGYGDVGAYENLDELISDIYDEDLQFKINNYLENGKDQDIKNDIMNDLNRINLYTDESMYRDAVYAALTSTLEDNNMTMVDDKIIATVDNDDLLRILQEAFDDRDSYDDYPWMEELFPDIERDANHMSYEYHLEYSERNSIMNDVLIDIMDTDIPDVEDDEDDD